VRSGDAFAEVSAVTDVPISFLPDGVSIDGDETVWADGVPLRPDLAPGTAEWCNGQDGAVAALLFICPCGCARLGALTVNPKPGAKGWAWDGNREKPSLLPSIQKTSPCGWHGYLIDGVFRSV
jgi:hypothetical protein